MAIQFLQYPPSCSLAQSPIVFSVRETTTGVFASSSFQYLADLWYWTGSNSESSSLPNYTLSKYPNDVNAGIFDFGRIISSTLTDPAEGNQSQVTKFKAQVYYQYTSSGVFVSSSKIETGIYKALDGYSLFQENVTQSLEDKTPHWPLMSDGPATQSAFADNYGRMSVFSTSGAGSEVTEVQYTGSNGQTFKISVSTSEDTQSSLTTIPIGLLETDMLLSSSVDWYEVKAVTSTGEGTPIRFNVECQKKYPNVRIKWKNRYGAFDFLNFNLVSTQGFQTSIRSYEKQLGSWNSSTLSYNNYDSVTQNYIADSDQTLQVNTDYLPESYNEILKQLLVSDEIYWLYDDETQIRPLTIQTSNLIFKTGVKDKLIQYTIDFKYGQGYKLVL